VDTSCSWLQMNEGGLMLDLFYLSIGLLFLVGCRALVRGIERL